LLTTLLAGLVLAALLAGLVLTTLLLLAALLAALLVWIIHLLVSFCWWRTTNATPLGLVIS
jgi:hypothetical protein